MTVLTGRSGQLFVDAARVARCTGWSLDEQRPMLESTTVDVWDRTVVPGRRSGTGSAKLLYDPDDAAAGVFFDSILLNTKNEVPVSLLLDSLTGESYPVTVHVSGASHAVAKGEAQMRDISFKLSDISVDLEIIGNAKAAKDATQFYTGAVYGLSGAWTFLWTSSGPTIADPTSQSTNVTFPDLGTFTLTLTATLGTTVLTDTLTVEVIAIPLLVISRPTSLMESTGAAADGTCCIDSAAQSVYHIALSYPDASVGTESATLSKLDYFGTRLLTKRISGLGAGGTESPLYLQVLSSGELFIVTRSSTGAARWIKLSSDLSTIVWQFRSTDTDMNGFVYDPVTNRVFFQYTYITGSPTIGYISAASGAVTKVTSTISPSFTPRTSSPLLLASGKVLIAFADGATNRISFVECNNDLKVSGTFAPVKVVEHTFSYGLGETSVLIETDNYIASVSAEELDAAREGLGRNLAQRQQELRTLIDRIIEEGVGSGAFDPRDRDRAGVFVLDACFRFVHPVAVELEADVPQTQFDQRVATIAAVVLRSLVNGAV